MLSDKLILPLTTASSEIKVDIFTTLDFLSNILKLSPFVNKAYILVGFILLLIRHIISFSELVNSSACINQLLLAGKKRVTFRANFNVDIFPCRTGLYNLAAGAGYTGTNIFRMDITFQRTHLFLSYGVL